MKTHVTGAAKNGSTVIRRQTCGLGLMAAGLMFAAGAAQALTVVEDFEFYANGPLGNNAGGSGFKGAWTTNTSMFSVNATTNLKYSATGYEASCLSTGAVAATTTSGALIKRAFAAPIPGTTSGKTVWFTILIRPTSGGRMGFNFNATGTDRTTAISGFISVGTDFRIVTNGVLFSAGKTLTANTTCLILGSMVLYDTGASTVSYWLNPSNLTSTNTVGLPDLTYQPVFNNSLGASIANVGIEAYSDANCLMDAIRVSDGNGDADQAFLDVTRATPKALFGPVQFNSLAEVTNKFLLIDAIASNDWQSADDGNYGQGGFLRSSAGAGNVHHIYVPDSNGAAGGGNDVFGDCTIDYDMRANGALGRLVGAFFLGVDPSSRASKHWLLNTNIGSNTNYIRAWYNRSMTAGGGSVETSVTNALNCSDWRHVRLDVRRVNGFTQVEVRNRIWNSAHDFRGPPAVDTTTTFAIGHSYLMDSEVGFSAYYQSGSSADIDNVAIYRYGGAPDWYLPRGTLFSVR